MLVIWMVLVLGRKGRDSVALSHKVHVMDYSGGIWLSCFQDTATQILGGKSSQELGELKEQVLLLNAQQL